MTDQQLFDKVSTHLLTQGVRSYGDNPRSAQTADDVVRQICLYRGPDGLKCAAGIMIPDHLYTPLLEGKACSEVSVIHAMPEVMLDQVAGKSSDPVEPLLQALQSIHDSWEPQKWRYRLREEAQKRGFDQTVLDFKEEDKVNIAQIDDEPTATGTIVEKTGPTTYGVDVDGEGFQEIAEEYMVLRKF